MKKISIIIAVVLLIVLAYFLQKPQVQVQAPVQDTSTTDIRAACESALMYTTFLNAEDADAFIQECIDGKHPDVIEQYNKQVNSSTIL